MSKFRSIVAGLCLSTFLFTALAQENLLRNGDFEEEFLYVPKGAWSNYDAAEKDGVRRELSSGGLQGQCLMISDDTELRGGGVFQDFPVEAGQSYEVQAYVKSMAGRSSKGAFLQVRMLPQQKIFQMPLEDASEDQFNLRQMQFTVPEGSEKARLFIYTHVLPKPALLVDDLRVYKLKKKRQAP